MKRPDPLGVPITLWKSSCTHAHVKTVYSTHAAYCAPNISQESYCKMHAVGTLCGSLCWAVLEQGKCFTPLVSTIKLSV